MMCPLLVRLTITVLALLSSLIANLCSELLITQSMINTISCLHEGTMSDGSLFALALDV
jgi:hypothetical protein